MAFVPCSWHGALYKGGANTCFLRAVKNGEVIGGKLQLCPNDATVAVDYLDEHVFKVSDGDTFYDMPQVLPCAVCNGPVTPDAWAFFGNTYFRGMAERQYYGRLHEECVPSIVEDLHLELAR